MMNMNGNHEHMIGRGDFLEGTGGDDVLLLPNGIGNVNGYDGDDTLNLIAQEGLDQIHAYPMAGDDLLNLRFGEIDEFSHGHHVNGDGFGGTKVGSNTFNFTDLDNVNDVVVGRIEDFNPSEDRIQIDGQALDFDDLPSNVRVVAYNGEFEEVGADPQQWLLVDTGGGHLFYALGGARIETSGDGDVADREQETHFIREDRVLPEGTEFEDLFASLPDVRYVDPQDYLPDGETPDGGDVIVDTDRNVADVEADVPGTLRGDVIAAGLNDDVVYARAGDDRVWGGSGHDKIQGNIGDDVLNGGPGNDLLMGGEGDDVLGGDAGRDNLSGHTGADRFVYATGDGTDTVLDFTQDVDRIDLSGTGVAGFGELGGRVSQDGDDAVIDFGGGNVLTLRGIESGTLRAQDFVFADGEAEPMRPAPIEPTPEPLEPVSPEPAPAEGETDGGNVVVSDFDVDGGGEQTFDTYGLRLGSQVLELQTAEEFEKAVFVFEHDGRGNTDAVIDGSDLVFVSGRNDRDEVTESVRFEDILDGNDLSEQNLAAQGVDMENLAFA